MIRVTPIDSFKARRRRLSEHARGFTLIEMMVVVALVAVIASLVAPSFQKVIQKQRVQSITSQLVTDIQYGRSEAATRNNHVKFTFKKTSAMSCYTIYTYPEASVAKCDCTLATPCVAAGTVELRTVRILPDTAVQLVAQDALKEFALDSRNGGMFRPPSDALLIPSLNEFAIDTSVDTLRKLRTIVSLGGRPSVCAPTGSTMSAPACP